MGTTGLEGFTAVAPVNVIRRYCHNCHPSATDGSFRFIPAVRGAATLSGVTNRCI
jgi:hypothetical protein